MATINSEQSLKDLDLEQLLLHILVFDDNKQKILQRTYPALFTSEFHKHVFRVIKSLNGRCDLMSVVFHCVQRQREIKSDLNIPLTESFIIDVLFNDPVIKYWKNKYNAFTVLQHLKELFYRRTILDRAKNLANIAEKSTSDNLSKDSIIEANKIQLLDRKLLKNEKTSFAQIAKETSEKINTKGDIIETGFSFIDKRLSGLTKKCISSLLARPKHFKSSFCDSLISTTVESSRNVGLIISLEDPVAERIKRIIAPRLGISLEDMRFKRVTVTEKDISSVLEGTLNSRLHIVDVKDVLTYEDACGVIYDIKPDIFIVDHIQKFQLDDMVTGIIKAIKAIEVAAMRTDSHGLITSQVTDKKFFGREDQSPEPSDAQWTSALYQSSSEMFALYYQYQTTHNVFEKNFLRFKILAARYAGAVSDFQLEINPDRAHIIGEIA